MIGEQIRRSRVAQGLTLHDLSGKTALSPSYLSMLESGARELNVRTLRKVAIGLDVPIGGFFQYGNADLTADEWKVLDAWRKSDYPTLMRMIADQLEDTTP